MLAYVVMEWPNDVTPSFFQSHPQGFLWYWVISFLQIDKDEELLSYMFNSFLNELPESENHVRTSASFPKATLRLLRDGYKDGIDPFLGNTSLFPDAVNKISNHTNELFNSTASLQHFWYGVGAARCLPILQLSKSLGHFSTIKLAPHIQHFGEVSFQRWCSSVGVLQGSPLPSQMATTLVGTLPLLPNCITLMHFLTFFPPKMLSFCLLCLGSEPAILCFSDGLPCFIPGYIKSRQILFHSWSQPFVTSIIPLL